MKYREAENISTHWLTFQRSESATGRLWLRTGLTEARFLFSGAVSTEVGVRSYNQDSHSNTSIMDASVLIARPNDCPSLFFTLYVLFLKLFISIVS